MLTVQTPSSSKRSKRFLTNSYDVRAFASQFPSPRNAATVFPKSFVVEAESLQSFTPERLFLFCVYKGDWSLSSHSSP